MIAGCVAVCSGRIAPSVHGRPQAAIVPWIKLDSRFKTVAVTNVSNSQALVGRPSKGRRPDFGCENETKVPEPIQRSPRAYGCSMSSAYQLRLLDGKLHGVRDADGSTVEVDFGRGSVQVGIVVGLATEPDLRPVAATTLRSLCYEDIPPARWKESIEQAVSRLRREKHLPIAEGTW